MRVLKVTVRQELVSEDVEEEVVVFDPASNTAHRLDGDVASVWHALAKTGDPVEIARATDLPQAQVFGTLERLLALDLVEPEGLSRRAALARLAVAGGAVAVPVIASLSVPAAAAAASGTGVSTAS
jgi:hypothetical protein